MKQTIFLAAILGLLVGLISSASTQERNELTGVIGRTFVSDQGVTGTSTPGALLTSGHGLTFEANYGRRLIDFGLVGLTAEVPFVVNVKENVHYDLNLVPKDYKSFFVTPSIRANLFPDNGLSPWVSVGGGFGYFKESSSLEFFEANTGKTGTTTGVSRSAQVLTLSCLAASVCGGKCATFFPVFPS